MHVNTTLRDLSLIWTLLHCAFMFMPLYESRYSTRKTNILTALYMVPLISLNMANVIFLGIEGAGRMVMISCVLPSLLFFFLMTRHRDSRFFFTFWLSTTVVLEVLFATNLLDTFLGFGNYTVMFFSRLLIFPLLEFGVVKYLRRPYHLLQRQTKKGWGVFSFLAALFYLALIMETYHPSIILDRMEYVPHLVLLLVLVPAMYAAVFKVLWTQLRLFNAAEENRALNMQIKMTRERLANGSESENRLRILRHDMKHKMLLLDDYIRSGRLAEAGQYINSLLADIDKSTLKTYCANHSVNVVLSYYGKIAGEKGIQLETGIQLPEDLAISETDLAVVLSNGLENAINAAADCGDKRILIKSFIEVDKIYLEIKNPFHSSVVFDGKIPQSRQENHGFGVKSMAAIVEKYEGVYSFTVENGYFSFRCSM